MSTKNQPSMPVREHHPVVIAVVSILALLVAMPVGAFLWQSAKLANEQSRQAFLSQSTPEQINDRIAWKPVQTAALVKSVPVAGLAGSIQIFDIGAFTQGPYVGKMLALVVFQGDYGSTPSAYGYYVSDSQGRVIAWDPSYLHDNNCWSSVVQASVACIENSGASVLGFSSVTQTTLSSILPLLLSNLYKTTALYLSGGSFATNDVLQTSLSLPLGVQMQPVASTSEGWPILKTTTVTSSGVIPVIAYYLALPYGAYLGLSYTPDFMDSDGTPRLTWISGDTAVPIYRFNQYAYGWQDCFTPTSASFQSTLVRTGITANGEDVWEPDPARFDSVYQCFYQKTIRYDYDQATKSYTTTYPMDYETFLGSHPIFFYKNEYGDWMAFMRDDVVPAAEKAKPVIYLYPQKEEQVHVAVDPIGGFTKTEPAYNDGWTVQATPAGVLTNLADGLTYPYLFWEGGKDGAVETPQAGFVVRQSDVASTLREKLALFGLNEKEQDDFVAFWAPRLTKAPYYFITFISRSEIDRVAPLIVVPRPDTVIRVLMDYQPLSQPILVPPLSIMPTERNGFTVVEWGGILRD